MMRVYFSPIVWDKKIEYLFEDDILTVKSDGIEEEYDFTGLPDGKLDVTSVETPFSFQPILEAEKENGVLFLTLLNPIKEDASEFSKFPEWIEVGEESGEIQVEL